MFTFPFGFFQGSSALPPEVADALLNDYPYASGAYSLRKLDKNYTGNCIRVRRSNDNNQTDIGFDSNGDLDTGTLLTFVGNNSAFVTVWYDQSGLGNNMEVKPNAASTEPRIVNSGTIDVVNSRPAIYFDGSDDQFMMYDFVGKSTQTFFGAGLINAQDGLFAYSDNPTTSYYLTLQQGNTGSADQNAGTLSNYYTSGNFTTRNRGALYNDVATGQASIQAISNLDLSTWNNYIFNGYPGFKFQGYMQEVVTYDSSVAGSTDIPNFTAIQGAIGKQYKGWSDYSLFSTEFDGILDYVDLGTGFNSSLELGDSFSISAWVKFGNTATNRSIVSNIDAGTGIELRVLTPENIRFILVQGGGNYIYVDTSFLSIDTWHHVVATYDGSNNVSGINVYIDGSLDNDSNGTSGTITSISNSESLIIGARPNLSGAYEYAGNIDEVAIFDSALSSSDVTTIYNSGVPNDITSLSPTAWWRMGDESGYQYLTNKMSYSKYSTYFDGADDYVGGIDSSQFAGASKISISVWAKYQGGNRFIISTEGSANNQFMINTWAGTLYWQVRNGSVTYGSFSFSGLLNVGDWFHLVCTFDGTQSTNADKVKMYFNGTPKTLSFSGTQPTTISSSIGDIDIGRQSTYGSNYWLGNIDDVSIYSSALSVSDVTDIYNNGKPKDESSRSNIVGYYKMGDNNVFPKIPNEIAYSKKSLEFDGVDDDIVIPDSASLDLTDTITLSAWIKPASVAGWDGIIYKNNNAQGGAYHMGISNTGKLGGGIKTNSGVWHTVESSASLQTGVWQHVAVVIDLGNTFCKLYINGSPDGSDTSFNHSIGGNTNPVTIGEGAGSGERYSGLISDVIIFSDAKSATDISNIYNNGMPKDESSTSNIAGYWKMGDGDYFPTATDSSGNGNNGTIYNETGAEMIQLDTPNGWATAQNETAPEMIQGDTPKGNHGYMDNMDQAAIVQDAPT